MKLKLKQQSQFKTSIITNSKEYFIKTKTTGATCGAGPAYPSKAPEFTSSFSEICVVRS